MFVLKHNDSFTVLDARGDAHGKNEKEHHIADGLICRDTRIVSHAALTIGGLPAVLLDSGMDEGGIVFEARLSNPPQPGLLPRTVDIIRSVVLCQDSLYQKITLHNNGAEACRLPLEFRVGADFKDLFELRGFLRQKPSNDVHAQRLPNGVIYAYQGHDGVAYRAEAVFSAVPDSLEEGVARFDIELPPQASDTIYLRLGTLLNNSPACDAESFEHALRQLRAERREFLARQPRISSSNPLFDQWVAQNAADIALLTTRLETGDYPYAGVPWYSTVFGRDGIITAMEMLWQDPALARGVLACLAKHQAADSSAYHDSEPGKILHEIRAGELARMGEIPHAPYYGTIDATPLFVMLAGAYYGRTGDLDFIRGLWSNIERALHWIDRYGDRDGDGFVEYARGADTGLRNQGWKDSGDSISHADGHLAEGSIALCEVQGYVYAAKCAAAEMARALGDTAAAARLDSEAATLFEKFNDIFWSETFGNYALALDGEKRPCLVDSSNTGHLLFCGIVPPGRAIPVADRLMSPAMFSGWGIRTLGSNEKRYEPVRDPQGYHNGTVWTHDTAICAAGFERYGMEDKAMALLSGLFGAAQAFPALRLPELFGGQAQGDPELEDGKPARYPVACNPQAWASGAGSLLIQAMLGLKIDGRHKRITVDNPCLPEWVAELTIEDLRIGEAKLSLRFQRKSAAMTSVEVIGREGDIDFVQAS